MVQGLFVLAEGRGGRVIQESKRPDAVFSIRSFFQERVMGFEPTTSTLARLRSTPELHPLICAPLSRAEVETIPTIRLCQPP